MHTLRLAGISTVPQIIAALVEGNPGAISACVALMQCDAEPDNPPAGGGLWPLIQLDSIGVYGSDIYILFSDICRRDPVAMWAVLRAFQLGDVSAELIRDASGRQDRSGRDLLDIPAIYEKVKERLPGLRPMGG